MYYALLMYSLEVLLEAMKSKSSESSAIAFRRILENAKDKPRTITTDNDSGFFKGDMKAKYKEGAKLVGKPDENTFEQLLEQNEIQITTNALRDHHALGGIDRFARTFKNALPQSMLREKTTDWAKFVIDTTLKIGLIWGEKLLI